MWRPVLLGGILLAEGAHAFGYAPSSVGLSSRAAIPLASSRNAPRRSALCVASMTEVPAVDAVASSAVDMGRRQLIIAAGMALMGVSASSATADDGFFEELPGSDGEIMALFASWVGP